jgi:hypothetical protein
MFIGLDNWRKFLRQGVPKRGKILTVCFGFQKFPPPKTREREREREMMMMMNLFKATRQCGKITKSVPSRQAA